MKKTFLILLLGILMLLAGCTPLILNVAASVGMVEVEPLHLLSAKPIPEPEFETCSPIKQANIEEIFTMTNQERIACDLPELTLSPTLSRIAMLRAADMAENDYFKHTSPTGETAFTLMENYQIFYFKSSENIGKGKVSCRRIMRMWMDSLPHWESILSSAYHQLGIGIVEAGNGDVYWVQLFTN